MSAVGSTLRRPVRPSSPRSRALGGRPTVRPAPTRLRSTAAASVDRLHLVATPARAARWPFVSLVLGLLAGGLVGLLLVNTLAAQDAFRLQNLRDQAASLGQLQQALTSQVVDDQSPGYLAAAAARLGMDPGSPAQFVRLRDGRLVGLVFAAPPPPAAAPPTTAARTGTGGRRAATAGAAGRGRVGTCRHACKPARSKSGAGKTGG
jgi:hypothetical protein